MRFNKGECKVLHLWGNNLRHQYMLGVIQLENSLAEKDLEVLVDSQLNVNQQYALAAKKSDDTQGCSRHCISSRLREAYSALLRPHVEYWVRFWAPQPKRDVDILENIQQRPREMMWGMEHLCCEERQRDLFSLEKRKLRSILRMCMITLKEGAKRTDPGAFQCCPGVGPETVGTIGSTGCSL